jgi:hypothetical protein
MNNWKFNLQKPDANITILWRDVPLFLQKETILFPLVMHTLEKKCGLRIASLVTRPYGVVAI